MARINSSQYQLQHDYASGATESSAVPTGLSRTFDETVTSGILGADVKAARFTLGGNTYTTGNGDYGYMINLKGEFDIVAITLNFTAIGNADLLCSIGNDIYTNSAGTSVPALATSILSAVDPDSQVTTGTTPINFTQSVPSGTAVFSTDEDGVDIVFSLDSATTLTATVNGVIWYVDNSTAS